MNIQEALQKSWKKISGYVQKQGTNTAQNYKFAGEISFIEHVRPVLAEEGITVAPIKIEVIANETVKIPKYNPQGTQIGERTDRRILACWTYRFSYLETHLDVVGLGEGIDSGDKSSYKAATGAYKYALRQAFMIATGDDPEIAREDEEEQQKHQEQPYKSKEPSHRDQAEQHLKQSGYVESKAFSLNSKSHETKSYDLKSDKKEEGPVTEAGLVCVHFGKNKGIALKDLPEKSLRWYMETWAVETDAKPNASEADRKLIKALEEYARQITTSEEERFCEAGDDEIPF